MAMERFLLYGVALLLVLAPLPFGAVQGKWSAVAVLAALALGVVWMACRSRRGLAALPWKDPLLLLAAAFAAVVLVQLVPVPGAVLELASPRAAELRAELEPGGAAAEAWRPISLYPWATRQALLRFLSCMVVALAVADLATERRARRTLAAALICGGAFQAAYGLAEYLSGRQQIFGYVKQHYLGMATGTFINKNHFAGYLAMVLPLTLALAISIFPRARSEARVPFLRRLAELPEKQIFSSVLVLLLGVLMATAVVASHSRAGTVAALAGVAALGILTALRGRVAGIAVTALAAAVTLLIFSQGRGRGVLDAFMSAPASFSGGELGRTLIWQQAGSLALAFPLWGVGLGAFQYVFPGFRTSGPGVFLSHAHNDYLELVAETGVVGLIVFAAGAILVVVALTRHAEGRPDLGPFGMAAGAGVLAMALHSLVDFNLAIPANALTFSALAGLFIGSRRPGLPRLAAGGRARRTLAPSFLAPAAAMGLVAVLAIAPVAAGSPPGEDAPLAPEPAGEPGLARLLDGDNADRLFDEAATRGRRAVEDLQSLNEKILAGEAIPEDEIQRVRLGLQEALQVQEEGIRQAPTYPRGHLYRGHLRSALCAAESLGEGAGRECAVAGVEDFRTALRLNPMSAATHAKVARFYLRAWTLLDRAARREAVEIIEEAARMNWDDPSLKEAAQAARREVAG